MFLSTEFLLYACHAGCVVLSPELEMYKPIWVFIHKQHLNLCSFFPISFPFQSLTAQRWPHQWMVHCLVTHCALLHTGHCVRLNVRMDMNSQEVAFFGVLHCREHLKDTGTVMMLDVKVKTNASCKQTNRHMVCLQENSLKTQEIISYPTCRSKASILRESSRKLS